MEVSSITHQTNQKNLKRETSFPKSEDPTQMRNILGCIFLKKRKEGGTWGKS